MFKKKISAFLIALMLTTNCGQAFASEGYDVVGGDTLTKIANKYGVTVEELVELNSIPNRDLIYVGQKLMIPNKEIVTQPTEETTTVESPTDQNTEEIIPDETILSPEEGIEEDPIVIIKTEDASKYLDAVDVDFAENVVDVISSLGDNPDLGYRTSGSDAEKETALFIANTFEEIGLQNVTTDTFTADTWSFNKGRLYYIDKDGNEQYMLLGSYATHFVSEMEEFEIVYANRGTANDYVDLDVKDKIVLVDINQSDEWWINMPAHQASVHGAKAIIAVNVDGYAQHDGDTIGVQDVCGPADKPALAISQNNADILKNLIEENGGSLKIKLDVESIIGFDGEGQNVWGEIPGKTDEVMYFMAHMDGYFHSYFDDASGVGAITAIAKAMIDSGYTPDKTIRFIAHGSEEWGKSDAEYDWAKGAYEQIMTVHPEWAEKGFALINVDGFYALEGANAFELETAYELADYVGESATEIFEGTGYDIDVISEPSLYTEDFSYSIAGIPNIVTGDSGESSSVYAHGAYHSSADNKEYGFDKDVFKTVISTLGELAIDLDGLAVKPLDFSDKFTSFEETYVGTKIDMTSIIASSEKLTEKIITMNEAYENALELGNTEEAEAIREEAISLNKGLYEIYKKIRVELEAFNWSGSKVFRHEVYQDNLDALYNTLEALESGNADVAIDEHLYNIDYNWYAYDFDKEVFDYTVDKIMNKSDGTFGEGQFIRPHENLFETVKSLLEKYGDESADLTVEIEAINNAIENQERYLDEIVEEENTSLLEIESMINILLEN